MILAAHCHLGNVMVGNMSHYLF